MAFAQRIEFAGDNGIALEGLLSEGTSDRGVVITHPHPLYGGDMANIVVETIYQVYKNAGHTTLRFNFRGVGGSSGTYDDGNGEQADAVTAFDFLKNKGVKKVDLAGYSFGAWILAKMAEKDSAHSVMMVSPPAAMMPFDTAVAIPNLKLAVTGSRDEFAPPETVEELVRIWNPAADFSVISGADHFFYGYTDKLAAVLKSAI